jgi:hypothetical protein
MDITQYGPEHPDAGHLFPDTRVEIDLEKTDGARLREIVLDELPIFLELFARKNREYGDGNSDVLGPKGQFSDIWRKIAKLKTGMWDGREDQLTSEGVDEILRDLIGHCFLALSQRRRGVE